MRVVLALPVHLNAGAGHGGPEGGEGLATEAQHFEGTGPWHRTIGLAGLRRASGRGFLILAMRGVGSRKKIKRGAAGTDPHRELTMSS